tara:strand:- start:1456 stop:1791 length:336 start_codon:yes stop_codon:yes gene_type:complete
MEKMIDDYGVLKIENTKTGNFDYPIYVNHGDGKEELILNQPDSWTSEFKAKICRGLARRERKRFESGFRPENQLLQAPLDYAKYKPNTPEPTKSVNTEDFEVEERVPVEFR